MSTSQQFNTIDHLRLEVEVEPNGPYNLLPNSDGELGGWGWITPVANTTMRGQSGQLLVFKSPPTPAPSYFYSEPVAVAAGEYASASLKISTVFNYIRMKIEWLDYNGNYIGASAQTGYINGGGGFPVAISPTLAPANTAFARLRVDHYSNNLGANPTADAEFSFYAAKLAKASSAAALTTVRTNLIKNPSFEVNTSGWSATARCTIARSTTQVAGTGVASLAATATASGGLSVNTVDFPASAGRDYVFQFVVKTPGGSRKAVASIEFRNSANAVLLRVDKSTTTTQTGAWRTQNVLATAPVGTTRAICYAGVTTSTAGEVVYFDRAMATAGSDTPFYFDGDTADSGTVNYAWTGTANDSTSTMTDTSLDSLAETGWRNILGPTRDIQIDREELNLGTMTASILDATLDPSQTEDLRPGRKARLLLLQIDPVTEGDLWTPLFTGTTTRLEVDYDEKIFPPKPPRVGLTAVDNTQTLANARRPDGVATIDELPYVLEGAGVPWRVNNSSAHVTTATTVSTNDNASALDQVAITRDSTLGAAWVDRFGVLVARDYHAPINLPNPSFEGTTSGWFARSNSTIAASTSATHSGSYSMRLTATAAGSLGATTAVGTASWPTKPGARYTGSFWAKANASGGNGRAVTLYASYYNSGGTLISSDALASGTTSNTVWTEFTSENPSTAPAGTAYVAFYVHYPAAGASEVHFVDDVAIQVAHDSLNITLDESVYSELDLRFSTDDCINSVMVKYLRFKSADGSTEEVAFGPYENVQSVEEWGRRTTEFTVHGVPEGELQDYATEVLLRNSEPTVDVNTLRIPISREDGMVHALWDLGYRAQVVNAEKGINQSLRINRISHIITPDKWLMDLGFTGVDSVASPQTTPPVQNNALAIDSGWQDVSFQNSWTNFDARTVQYRRLNGWVHFRGIMKNGTVGSPAFQVPTGFKPVSRGGTSEHHFPVASNGLFGFVQVWNNGDIVLAGGSNIWVDLSGIRYEVGA